ncbi:hypothetical protein N0V82_007140 [Gnomoniopsis sp. IMI 355080]|nr:hypothetical protein N0V82_007140 [Gnomoniopsis sp. IMI 355080]
MPSKQGNAKRGETSLPKNRGTGFEDGFADPPVTPDEHANELKIYDPRIEECIQRYTARRRMSSDRAQLFMKYLFLGGIDTSQRQFTGTAQHVKDWKGDGYGPDELRAFTANEFLGHGGDSKGLFYSPDVPEHWDVDFAGIVAGFLGSYLPEQTYANSPEIRLAADTVLNFLNYVLLELPKIGEAGRVIPGDFNLACRVLFCSTGAPLDSGDFNPGYHLYQDEKVYSLPDGETIKFPDALDPCVTVPANFDAQLVFRSTIALHEPDHIARINDPSDPVRVINAFEEVYEVREIVFAERKLVDIYEGITEANKTARSVQPVGHIVLLPTIIEDGWDNHPTYAEGRVDSPGKPISLYMDHDVLKHLGVGMKMRATVCQLNLGSGLEFIKEVAELVPSFHVYLPQTLMMHYKPPKPDTRPPPSADDPDAEDRRMAALMEQED